MPYKQNNIKTMRILTILLVAILIVTPGFAQSTAMATGRRVALVVGNGAYEANPLRNPPNDADDVSAALKDAGFEVTVVKDADQSAFERAVNDFAGRLRGADTGLFYYAGHGVQVDGVNYLIPVRPRIDNATDVKFRAVAVDAVVARMEQSGVRTALVFLDSCRDNPFPGASRSGSRGLAVVPTPKTMNSLIAYATAPGDVAADGTGRNGVFSGAFITQLQVPGQELSELMRKVRAEVAAVTGGRQNPRVDDGMKEVFFFVSPEQMASRAEAALRANQAEIARLEKELAERQTQINATRDAQARQALEVEQQRQQALATAKRLETESLAREAERQRRLADEANRTAAERTALAAEQARQQSDLAAIAASRRAELERLAGDAASDNPDVLIETIERLDKVLAEVASEYAAAWRSIEAKLREGYQPRLAAFTAAKPEIWETDSEFRTRVQRERSALERDMEATVAARKSELEAEQRRQTESMRKQYEDALATLSRKTWVLQGQAVHLAVGEFDRNARTWPFTVSSADPSIPLAAQTVVADLNKAFDVRQAIIDLDAAVKAGALAGQIEWGLRRNRDKAWYELIIRQVSVVNLSTSAAVAAWQGQDFVAYFATGKRNSPTRAVASLRLSSPAAGVRVFRDGHDLGALPVTVSFPPGPYSIEARWPNGKSLRLTGSLELGALESRTVEIRFLHNLVMLPIAGGSFEMGSLSSSAAQYYEVRPVSRITLSSFSMSVTEVTQAQYLAVMGTNPGYFPERKDNDPSRPVNNVSWYDAILFCNRLSQLEGLEPAYYGDQNFQLLYENGTTVFWKRSSKGYRLPTEAEWEYAARGGVSSKGFIYAGSDELNDVGWFSGNTTNSGPKPVGAKQPNELGLYDMSGNVMEWCWDWHGAYSNKTKTDPIGPATGEARILRGGASYYSDRDLTSVYARSKANPGARDTNFGFRIVRPWFD